MRYRLTRFLWVPFAAAILLLVISSYASAQTTPRQKADAMWANVASHVSDRQAAYFASHGRYFQGIKTHTPAPADGTEAAPDLSRRPTDQTESWQDAGFALPATMPAALEIHVYDGPQGKGYVAIVEVVVAGRMWRRQLATGGEAAHRTHGWRDVTPQGGP